MVTYDIVHQSLQTKKKYSESYNLKLETMKLFTIKKSNFI